jgi:DNA modification methylase
MNETWRIIQGDARKLDLPDGSMNMCVTSPPYWGLRDYGHEGQLGLESTPEQYVANMVEVFREVKRVLRDDGTLWLNIGDSYAGGGGFAPNAPTNQARASGDKNAWGKFNPAGMDRMSSRTGTGKLAIEAGLKHKDLVGIPWMLAFALRADGWYLRQDIIWHKPNPMPESVTDRCTKAHEYLFLLSKSERYYYDAGAIAEQSKGSWNSAKGFGGDNKKSAGVAFLQTQGAGSHHDDVEKTGRNRRSVWTVNTRPYRGAHFATFPPALIEPCILAGCPKGGTVLDPFGGSGTTAEVALKNGRNVVLNELNPEYIKLAEVRIAEATKQGRLW